MTFLGYWLHRAEHRFDFRLSKRGTDMLLMRDVRQQVDARGKSRAPESFEQKS